MKGLNTVKMVMVSDRVSPLHHPLHYDRLFQLTLMVRIERIVQVVRRVRGPQTLVRMAIELIAQ